MRLKNKYANRSRILEKKFRQLLKLFAMDLEAKKVVELSKLNRNTVNRYFAGCNYAISMQLGSPIEVIVN